MSDTPTPADSPTADTPNPADVLVRRITDRLVSERQPVTAEHVMSVVACSVPMVDLTLVGPVAVRVLDAFGLRVVAVPDGLPERRDELATKLLPILGHLNDEDRNLLLDVAAGDDPTLTVPADAVRLLCVLQSAVSHSAASEFPDVCNDCFCGKSITSKPGREDDWRNAGDSLAFIVRSSLRAAAALLGGEQSVSPSAHTPPQENK